MAMTGVYGAQVDMGCPRKGREWSRCDYVGPLFQDRPIALSPVRWSRLIVAVIPGLMFKHTNSGLSGSGEMQDP